MRTKEKKRIFIDGVNEAVSLGLKVSPLMLVMLIISSSITGISPIAMAWTSKHIIDGIAHTNSGSLPCTMWYLITEAVLAMLLLSSLKINSLISIILKAKLGHFVRERIITKVQVLSLSQMENPTIADLISRSRQNSESRPVSLLTKVMNITTCFISSTCSGLVLISQAPFLFVALLFSAIPILIADIKFNGDLFRIQQWKSPNIRMQTYIESILTRENSAKEIRVLGIASPLIKRFRRLFAELYSKEKALITRRSIMNIILSSTGQIILYIAFGWSIIQALNGSMTVGQVTMLMLLLRQAQTSIVSLMTSLATAYDDALHLMDYITLMSLSEDMQQEGLQCGCLPGDGIRLENVYYTYSGQTSPALQNISIHLEPGKCLVVLGENGSGKTTLIKLILGLYKPTSGNITLDGSSIFDWDRDALNRKFSTLFQDYQCYQMTVYDNVALGNIYRFNEANVVSNSINHAHASGMVRKLKLREQTQLGVWFDDGVSLSGGQWQRLALARAYMKVDADIFIFDEPTSAIDPVAEEGIYKNIFSFSKGKTLICITHRYSFCRQADSIIVLKEGKIHEQGTHSSLMLDKGDYYHAFIMQSRHFTYTEDN